MVLEIWESYTLRLLEVNWRQGRKANSLRQEKLSVSRPRAKFYSI
jgi:hypothetical protein